jgi:hypothetical protein
VSDVIWLMNFQYPIRRFVRSKAALALPVTFLILFVSTLAMISFTYYFAVEKVNAQGQILKVSSAKENMLSLDDSVLSTIGQPGSSSTFEIVDSGGLLRIQPTNDTLTLSINVTSSTEQTIFNSSIGNVIYELPYTPTAQTGLYLKGDSRTIICQTDSTISQLFIENGAEHPQINLQYRPTVTFATAGLENGKTVNNIRIYLVNLNTSASIASQGDLPLQISCTNTQLISQTYEVPSSENLGMTSVLNGEIGKVSIPISSTAQGAIIHLETVISDVSMERCIR